MSLRRFRAAALVLLLFVSGGVKAAPETIFEHYTSLDGLSNNYISDMTIDKRGFVWLCTRYGLSRFDGYRFQNYQTHPGDDSPLTHNRFLSVKQDVRGDLWLRTYDHKLYRFDMGKERFEPIVSPTDGIYYKVDRFFNASNNNTWINVFGEGLMCARFNEQSDDYSYQYYFDSDKIGHNVEKIVEDSKGDIWVLSTEGISRVDAQGTVTPFFNKEPLIDIVQSKQYIFAISNKRFVTIKKSNGKVTQAELYPNDYITSIAISTEPEIVYIGTKRSGVGRYYVEGKRFERDSRFVPRVRSMECDSKGILWITTPEAGISRYSPTRDNYKKFVHTKNVTLSYADSTTMVLERNNDTYVKMNRWGFGRYDREKDDIEPIFNDPKSGADCRFENSVICFEVDPTNVLWFSTQSRGLERVTSIESKADIFKPHSSINNSASNDIRSLLLDSKGNLWMGNKSGELFCYDGDRKLKHKFSLGVVYTIREDTRGNIWVGTKSDGAAKLTPHQGEYAIKYFKYNPDDINSLSGNSIYSIEQDSRGRLWFGTYGGAISMLETPESTLFRNSRNRYHSYPVDIAGKVRFVKQIPSGLMLVATVEGLIIFDPDAKAENVEFKRYQKVSGDIHSLGNNDVIHIFVDSKQRTWLSTYGGGLNLLSGFKENSEPIFELFSVKTGALSSNIVFASIEDGRGNIWVSTENGISKLDVDKHRFANYTKYDGVPETSYNEATLIRDSNNMLLFGTTGNIFIVDPDDFNAEDVDFRLTFTSFEVCNEYVRVGEGSPLKESITQSKRIVLPYDYSIFKIDYASLNFRAQSRLNYSYILEGHDTYWNMVGDIRSASYSNVPSGNYTLRVRCSDGGNSNEISVDVVILRPWWRTTVAYIIYFLLFATALYLVVKTLYTMLMLRQKVALEHQLTEHKLRFFTNISHELKTPLTIILGGIEDIANQNHSQAEQQTVVLVHRNAKRMLRLINQLLDFRKIVNNKFIINISDVDVVSLCRTVIDDFKELAQERKIELLFSTSADSLVVAIDHEAIESVVTNLLSNAFKFTANNGRIELKISHREEHFTIEVVDNGIGIPRDKHQTIFDRFAQVSKRAPRGEKGSGIGLSISKDIVQMHNGKIELESKIGCGARFIVTIPCKSSELINSQIDSVSVEENRSVPATVATTAENAPKVLLVEDNAELRLFLVNRLSASYHIYEAEDGIQALERLKEVTPDIIVTDLMMPRMDGNGLVKSVRADFAISHTPIIILTAKSEQQVRIEAMKCGADGYITKPFSVELLEARIENLLSSRRRLFEKYANNVVGATKVIDLSPNEIVITDRDEEFIQFTMSWIDDNIENSELTIDDLASHLKMGRTTMYNKLKSLTGKSPVELIKRYRINKAVMYFKNGKFTISEVAYKVGFSDPGYFSKCFKEQLRHSPADYIKSLNADKTE